MKFLILTVLLTVVQALPSIPRKAASDAANSASNVTQQSKENNDITDSPTGQNTEAPASTQRNGGEETSEHKQERVIVDALPRKDLWDKIYICLTAALVLIAAITFGAIRYQARETRRAAEATRDAAVATQASASAVEKQVGVMERQTKATEDAAAAAQQGVEIIISKERARLRVDLKPLTSLHTVDFTVNIYGTTPAFIVETSCAAYILPLEHVGAPDVSSAVMFPMYNMPMEIHPNATPFEQYTFLDIHEKDGAEDFFLSEIKQGRWFVGIRGFIKYRDVFDRDRVTKFRYIWKYYSSIYGIYGVAEGSGDWEISGADTDNCET